MTCRMTSMFGLALLLSGAATPLCAQDVFGSWDWYSSNRKQREFWSIKKEKDSWAVVATFYEGKKAIGRAEGQNVKMNGDKLEFTIRWGNKRIARTAPDTLHTAEAVGDKLIITWAADDPKGKLELTRFGVAAKKEDPKTSPAEQRFLANIITDRQKTTVTELALIIVMGNQSKAQFVKVTNTTKFILKDGETTKTFDQRTVLSDETAKTAFRENMNVTIERAGNVAVTVTFSPPKKK